jgi:hypothetical protein
MWLEGKTIIHSFQKDGEVWEPIRIIHVCQKKRRLKDEKEKYMFTPYMEDGEEKKVKYSSRPKEGGRWAKTIATLSKRKKGLKRNNYMFTHSK